MNSDASNRAEATFISAIARPPGEREAFLAQACESDTVLMDEVRSLIAAHEAAGSFLDREARPAAASEKPSDIIGPYKLREQIGEGGFGTVWVAD